MSRDIDIPIVRSETEGVKDQAPQDAASPEGRAKLHPRQEDRLRTLYAYDILDTPQESDFDDIVKLASAICETPISLISLVDRDRQWFKARTGFDSSQTGLDSSICSHAILEDDFLEIRDLSADPRTARNPLVTSDQPVRFYAGAKLVASNGLPIGTLCVLSDQPRSLSDLQRRALRTLADQVMTQLEMRRLLRNHEVLRNEIDHRVKNSLQTVLSLVRLYASKVSEASALEAFDAVERRLHSIISLHTELHDSRAIERVGLKSFLGRVIALLENTLPANIRIRQDLDNIDLSSSEATSVAVIVNEFVANAIKHAFPDGRDGTIDIAAHRDCEDRVVVTCEDDGVGHAAELAGTNPVSSLGVRIMKASAAQIGGALMADTDPPGYKTTLTFTPARPGLNPMPQPE